MRSFFRLSAVIASISVMLAMPANAQEPVRIGVQIAPDTINERGGVNGGKVEYAQSDATTPNAAAKPAGGYTEMKMKSIIVNELRVTDAVKYRIYQDQVPATLAPFGGKYVSRGIPEAIQGETPSPRVVVLEFPSREMALGWFHSPEFQRILAIRNESSTSRVYFLEGK
jgi:uncharacterized protein (DUF1330 family)